MTPNPAKTLAFCYKGSSFLIKKKLFQKYMEMKISGRTNKEMTIGKTIESHVCFE